MSDYRRCYVPGGSYFFTVVTEPGRVRTAYLFGFNSSEKFENGTQCVPYNNSRRLVCNSCFLGIGPTEKF